MPNVSNERPAIPAAAAAGARRAPTAAPFQPKPKPQPQPSTTADPGSQPSSFVARSLNRAFGSLSAESGAGLSNRFVPAPSPRSLAQQIRTEAGARSITVKGLERDLRALCKDPVLHVRDATDPKGYLPAAHWVASELEQAGFAPLGDQTTKGRSFLQGFQWLTRYEPRRDAYSWNVTGVLRGKDPAPGERRRTVMLVAHLDNLSADEKRDYLERFSQDLSHYEGANDNTAAVAAVLAAARALGAEDPSENAFDICVFIPSAEEEGLKGTEAFFTHPPEELGDISAVVNLEMIGRNELSEMLVYGGSTAFEAKQNPLYGRTLQVASGCGIDVKPGHLNDDNERWNTRSDHYVAQRAGIPAIMFHGRTTKGNYHTASDTLENLNMQKVQLTAQLAYRVVRDLVTDSQAPERPGKPLAATLNHYDGPVGLGLPAGVATPPPPPPL